jgi:hypothetical protein
LQARGGAHTCLRQIPRPERGSQVGEVSASVTVDAEYSAGLRGRPVERI